MTRREFMRLAGLMGGASLFAGCHILGQADPVPPYIEGAPAVDPVETLLGVESVYSVCGLCQGNCGIRCRVAAGKLVGIGGSPFHPISSSRPLPFGTPLDKAVLRSGSICAIGGSGVQTLYNPFRVAKPLKRVGPRGSGQWKGLTWDQALAEIINGGDLFGEGRVEGLKDRMKSKSGLDVMAGAADWGATTFLKSFVASFPGAGFVADYSSVMRDLGRDAATAVFGPGTGAVDADYRSARLVISFGDAPLDSGVPLVSLAREISDARVSSSGFKWAVVDPRLSVSAAKADLWVPVIPGKDLELVHGIVRALADISKPGDFSHEALRKASSPSPLVDLAVRCGVPEETIRTLAKWLSDAGPAAAVIPGTGIFRQPDGADVAKAVLALNLMVGSMPGSGGLKRRSDEFLEVAEKKLLKNAPKVSAAGAAGDGRALLVWNADPVYDNPRSTLDLWASQDRVPLFVAVDTEISETSGLADYILPDTTYLERWDLCSMPNAAPGAGIGVRSPVVGGFDPKTGKYFPIVPETAIMEDVLFRVAAELRLQGFEPDSEGRPKTASGYYRAALDTVLASMKESGLGVETGATATMPGLIPGIT